jgi:hypothetical protein
MSALAGGDPCAKCMLSEDEGGCKCDDNCDCKHSGGEGLEQGQSNCMLGVCTGICGVAWSVMSDYNVYYHNATNCSPHSKHARLSCTCCHNWGAFAAVHALQRTARGEQ